MKKKIIILIVILLIVSVIVWIILSKENDNITLEGRWTSTEDSLIKIIREYKDGQPVYANKNIVEYWLDLKKDGKYILYYNDVADKSRSNYSIEKNLLGKGNYNFDFDKKINALNSLKQFCEDKKAKEYFDVELLKQYHLQAVLLFELQLVSKKTMKNSGRILLKDYKPTK